MVQPGYLSLLQTGELRQRVETAYLHLSRCDVCPLGCHVDRRNGKLGVCRTGKLARVSSYGAHMGEEAPLSGSRGSGTIFFTRCNLHCQFCQNADISQTDDGRELQPEDLAGIMLALQASGCHNINLVSPSHVIPQILAAVMVAGVAGLHLPLVYNTGGYDSVEMLRLLDGVIDIYMPDMKYADGGVAHHYSLVRHYPQVNREAVIEMHRQVGDLLLDSAGLVVRGLLVRHLVLPHHLAGTEEIVTFLAEEISPKTYLNIMDQYHPAHKASRYPEINRLITRQEYEKAVQAARKAGLTRLDR